MDKENTHVEDCECFECDVAALQAGGLVLPMFLTDDDGKIVEIIYCDSIAGGRAYYNFMPQRLTLVRRLVDGSEFRMEYNQV